MVCICLKCDIVYNFNINFYFILKHYTHCFVLIHSIWLQFNLSPTFPGISGWLKVDLGKMRKITKIGVQAGSSSSWVTGYHLYYSHDGKVWNGFKDAGATSWKVRFLQQYIFFISLFWNIFVLFVNWKYKVTLLQYVMWFKYVLVE